MILLGTLAVGLVLVAAILALKLRGGFRIAAIALLCLVLVSASITLFSLRHLLSPSPEKYRPLAFFPVREVHKGAKWTANFKHAFQGQYEVGFTVKRLSMEPVEAYAADLVIEVKIHSKNGPYLIRRSNVSISPFWGTEEKGFVFVTYEAPRDVPIGQPVQLEVELVEVGPHFAEQYGTESLFVRKASDK